MQVGDQLLRSLLCGRYRRHGQKVNAELAVLLKGIKSVYLADESFVPAEKWAECVEKLRDNHSTSPSVDLSCVSLEHDTLVVNAAQLEQRLKRDVHEGFSRLVFVNVSSHLHSPEVLTSYPLKSVQSMLAELLNRMERSRLFGFETISVLHHVPLDVDWNMTTIFGWVLGYPVVYWFDQASAAKGMNCLAMEPLLVHEVTLPVIVEKSKHTVWSFSVPCAVYAACENAIRVWWEAAKQHASTRDTVLCLSKTERVLSSVAL